MDSGIPPASLKTTFFNLDFILRELFLYWESVAHAYNPIYLRDWDQEVTVKGKAEQKFSQDPISMEKNPGHCGMHLSSQWQ
jgi:hypothetical protein